MATFRLDFIPWYHNSGKEFGSWHFSLKLIVCDGFTRVGSLKKRNRAHFIIIESSRAPVRVQLTHLILWLSFWDKGILSPNVPSLARLCLRHHLQQPLSTTTIEELQPPITTLIMPALRLNWWRLPPMGDRKRQSPVTVSKSRFLGHCSTSSRKVMCSQVRRKRYARRDEDGARVREEAKGGRGWVPSHLRRSRWSMSGGGVHGEFASTVGRGDGRLRSGREEYG